MVDGERGRGGYLQGKRGVFTCILLNVNDFVVVVVVVDFVVQNFRLLFVCVFICFLNGRRLRQAQHNHRH